LDQGKLQLLKHLAERASETSAEAQPQNLASFSKRSMLTWAHGAIRSSTMHPIQEKFAGTMRLRRCSVFVRSRGAGPGIREGNDNYRVYPGSWLQHFLHYKGTRPAYHGVCLWICRQVCASSIPANPAPTARYSFKKSFAHTSWSLVKYSAKNLNPGRAHILHRS